MAFYFITSKPLLKAGCFSQLDFNGLQLNADFVLHKICDLGAVIS